jgi:hypothetical protein
MPHVCRWSNTKDIWNSNEILYIASDEKNRMFFDHFAAKHDLRFLDDYIDMANLSNLPKEHLGMIDVVVASRGRAFVGTYFSTFSGYITRLRGYYGMSKYTTFYGWNPVKYDMQKDIFFASSNEFKREYPIGWIEIDGDEKVSSDNEDERKIEDGEIASNNGEKPADSYIRKIRSLEETMINALGFLPNEDGDMEVAGNGTPLYIVFSTDCGPFQHWQSYLLFFSAMRVRQLGFITRIASGCTDEQQQEIREWHQEVNASDCVTCFLSFWSHLKPAFAIILSSRIYSTSL